MSQNMTVTTVVEHVFCPKFTYYGHVLGLKQYEGKRGTVKSGHRLHKRHDTTNKQYVPRKEPGTKRTEVLMHSLVHGYTGKCDELIERQNDITLIERKYTDRAIVGGTLRAQIGLLAILAEENFNKPVSRAVIVFQKKGRKTVPLDMTPDIKAYALKQLESAKEVVKTGKNPPSRFDNRCLNCCYRKICPTGSLKIDQ